MATSLHDRPNVALVTGGAQRIGAAIAKQLHHNGFNIALHYRNSDAAANKLAEQFNRARSHSAVCIRADLNNIEQVQQLALESKNAWGQLNALVNNASAFYPTPLEQPLDSHWDNLINCNLKGPFFLSQALAPALKASQGSIVNIVDIHGERPLQNHSIYCIAKAGVAMMTKSLAKELAPQVRVNGVAPGAILWPEQPLTDKEKSAMLNKIPLQTTGKTSDIARTVSFLIQDAPYINGQIIAVDGGRTLSM
jgi:pteridine reductase